MGSKNIKLSRRRINLLDLPNEILMNIMSFMINHPAVIARLGEVCKELYILSSSDYLWKSMISSHFCLVNLATLSNRKSHKMFSYTMNAKSRFAALLVQQRRQYEAETVLAIDDYSTPPVVERLCKSLLRFSDDEPRGIKHEKGCMCAAHCIATLVNGRSGTLCALQGLEDPEVDTDNVGKLLHSREILTALADLVINRRDVFTISVSAFGKNPYSKWRSLDDRERSSMLKEVRQRSFDLYSGLSWSQLLRRWCHQRSQRPSNMIKGQLWGWVILLWTLIPTPPTIVDMKEISPLQDLHIMTKTFMKRADIPDDKYILSFGLILRHLCSKKNSKFLERNFQQFENSKKLQSDNTVVTQTDILITNFFSVFLPDLILLHGMAKVREAIFFALFFSKRWVRIFEACSFPGGREVRRNINNSMIQLAEENRVQSSFHRITIETSLADPICKSMLEGQGEQSTRDTYKSDLDSMERPAIALTEAMRKVFKMPLFPSYCSKLHNNRSTCPCARNWRKHYDTQVHELIKLWCPLLKGNTTEVEE